MVEIGQVVEGMYLKLSTPKLYEFLKAKVCLAHLQMEAMVTHIKKNGILVETSLRKVEYMQ